MGPKKQQKGKGNEEEDVSTQELLTLYKKNCKVAQIPYSKGLEKLINDKLEEGVDLNEILLQEKLKEEGTIELCKALKSCNKGEGYKHLQSIRIWEGELCNQGIGSIYRFMLETKQYKISIIELINCSIGILGCEFLSRLLNPLTNFQIKVLTLDYNLFGNDGLNELMNSLNNNSTVNYLSLCYCGITADGVINLKNLFENPNSVLERLFIQGNPIENKGAVELLNSLSNKNELLLEEINMSNCSIGNDIDFINSLIGVMNSNNILCTINLKYNLISEEEFGMIVETLQTQKAAKDLHIFQFMIDEVYESKLFDKFFTCLKGRKKPKKKVIKKNNKN